MRYILTAAWVIWMFTVMLPQYKTTTHTGKLVMDGIVVTQLLILGNMWVRDKV